MNKVRRYERGWGAHFVASDDCRFRRNTLLVLNDQRIIISTVGNYHPNRIKISTFYNKYIELFREVLDDFKMEEIGSNRYYETMVFKAEFRDPYWEAAINKQVIFKSQWSINDSNCNSGDKKANEMHEEVIDEISNLMKNNLIKTYSEE